MSLIDLNRGHRNDARVNKSNRIWRTAAILVLAIVGCSAGFIVLSNYDAKVNVRRNRVANIDMAIQAALATAKEEVNKNHLDGGDLSASGNARTFDVKAVRQLLEKQKRVFNFCEEEVSALNRQRRLNEAVIFDLMDGVNECTILAVVCMILGLYAVFWLQRYT